MEGLRSVGGPGREMQLYEWLKVTKEWGGAEVRKVHVQVASSRDSLELMAIY